MKIDDELLGNTMFLNETFKEIYNLVSSNKMVFHACMLVNKDSFVFTLKEPKRIFAVEKEDSSYTFRMLNEDENFTDDNFEDIVPESEASSYIDKLRKRQTF